jgi:hypothetical protein
MCSPADLEQIMNLSAEDMADLDTFFLDTPALSLSPSLDAPLDLTAAAAAFPFSKADVHEFLEAMPARDEAPFAVVNGGFSLFSNPSPSAPNAVSKPPGPPPPSGFPPPTRTFPPWPHDRLDVNRLSNNQLSLLCGFARPSFLAVWDPLSGKFHPSAVKSPLAIYHLCPPEFTLGGDGVPVVVVNTFLPQHYLLVSLGVKVDRLNVFLAISSKITGKVVRVTQMAKARVTRRDGTFCSLDEAQVFGRLMQRNYKYGVYSYRVVVSTEKVPSPGVPTPAGMPLPMCWLSQNFDVAPAVVGADLRPALAQQIRDDLVQLLGAN